VAELFENNENFDDNYCKPKRDVESKLKKSQKEKQVMYPFRDKWNRLTDTQAQNVKQWFGLKKCVENAKYVNAF
jgi:hypothetical protein